MYFLTKYIFDKVSIVTYIFCSLPFSFTISFFFFIKWIYSFIFNGCISILFMGYTILHLASLWMHQRWARCSLILFFLGHTGRLHFPASLAINCGHMTRFWPIRCGQNDLSHIQPLTNPGIPLLSLYSSAEQMQGLDKDFEVLKYRTIRQKKPGSLHHYLEGHQTAISNCIMSKK